jgi:hypothetical protein
MCVDRCDDAATTQQQDEGAPDKQSLGHHCARTNGEHVGWIYTSQCNVMEIGKRRLVQCA